MCQCAPDIRGVNLKMPGSDGPTEPKMWLHITNCIAFGKAILKDYVASPDPDIHRNFTQV